MSMKSSYMWDTFLKIQYRRFEVSEEIESELSRLKKEKVVSEKTAELYLSHIRKLLNDESQEGLPEEK